MTIRAGAAAPPQCGTPQAVAPRHRLLSSHSCIDPRRRPAPGKEHGGDHRHADRHAVEGRDRARSARPHHEYGGEPQDHDAAEQGDQRERPVSVP